MNPFTNYRTMVLTLALILLFIVQSIAVYAATPEFTITNNPSGTPDVITMNQLTEGQQIKVFKSLDEPPLVTSTKIPAGTTTGMLTYDQLGATAGTLIIKVIDASGASSKVYNVAFPAEDPPSLITAPLSTTQIDVKNVSDKLTDTVTVHELAVGDQVQIYSSQIGGVAIATSEQVPAGSSSVSLKLNKLNNDGGTLFISVTSLNKSESLRIAKSYGAQSASSTLFSFIPSNLSEVSTLHLLLGGILFLLVMIAILLMVNNSRLKRQMLVQEYLLDVQQQQEVANPRSQQDYYSRRW